MLTYQIQVTATGGVLTDPALAQRFDADISATLQELGALGLARLVGRTPAGVSSGGGGLRGSLFTEGRGTPGQRSQVIASSAYYAPFVERGRHPGKRPPQGPILLWVTRKLGKSGSDAQRVAFLVSRKIGRVGTSGAAMVFRTAVELAPLVRARFEALVARLGAPRA